MKAADTITRIAKPGIAAMLMLVVMAMPVRAAEPTFPTGSRVGLVPPKGMMLSKAFPGFEDPDKKAAILVSAMPAAAYAEIEKTVADDVVKKQQITVDKREPITLRDRPALYA